MLLPSPTHPDLVAAAHRLRGHVVCCPVIGDLCLPGFVVASDLRLKAELLQPGGSLWFRGAQHWLLRQYGRYKGLVLGGDPAAIAAFARAARSQRMPTVAVVPKAPLGALRDVLAACGCAVHIDPAPGAVQAAVASGPFVGFVVMPEVEVDDFALGVATVVQELADELPADTERLVVAPVRLASAVARGVALLNLPWLVETAPRDHAPSAIVAITEALREQHRLATAPEGAAALVFAANRAEGTCVLLGV